MTEKDYKALIKRLRRNFATDIERRFVTGQLVHEAVEAGVSWERLVADVGISRATLTGYRDTFLFWGDIRAVGATTWMDYSRVTWWKSVEERSRVRARVIAGESIKVITAEFFERMREEHRAERAELEGDRSFHAFQAAGALRGVADHIRTIAELGGGDDSLEMERLRKTLGELLEAVSAADLTATRPEPRRRFRRAA
jgi:hypothetical protein